MGVMCLANQEIGSRTAPHAGHHASALSRPNSAIITIRKVKTVFRRLDVNRRAKFNPYRRPIWNLKLTISTWNARRWPRLQKANQVRVMGLFGFSFNEAGEVVQ